MYYSTNEEGEEYDLICRMQGEFYINMRANCCIGSAEFMDYGTGNIFISRDANLFMNRVLPSNYRYNKALIYESLKKDGIYIDEKNQEKDQQIETESNTKESEKDTETVISVKKKIKKSNKKNSRKIKNKVNSNTRLLDAETYDTVIKKKSFSIIKDNNTGSNNYFFFQLTNIYIYFFFFGNMTFFIFNNIWQLLLRDI